MWLTRWDCSAVRCSCFSIDFVASDSWNVLYKVFLSSNFSITIADHAELGQLDHRYAQEVPFINPVVTLQKIQSKEISLNRHPYRIRYSEALSEGISVLHKT